MSDPFRILIDRESDLAMLYITRNLQKTIEDYLPPGFSSIFIDSYHTVFVSEHSHPLAGKRALELEDFPNATLVSSLCPVTSIQMESIRLALADLGVRIHTLGLKVNRHTDVFASNLEDRLVPWFNEATLAPAFEPSDFHFFETDFDLLTDAYLIFRKNDLSEIQLSYLETMDPS